MEPVRILAKSSSRDEPYVVIFSKTETGLTIVCDCQAGSFGQLCKHKIQLALGNETMLFDRRQIQLLDKVQGWVDESELPKLFDELESLEQQSDGIKRRIKSTKAMIGRIMTYGPSSATES